MSARTAVLLAAAVAACLPRVAAAQRAPAPLQARVSLPLTAISRRLPRWSSTDVSLAGGFLALLWLDAAQTRSLSRGGWRDFRESNPLLGPRPGIGRINAYTAGAAVGTLVIAAALPPRGRRWWLTAACAIQAYTVAHTVNAGVALRLR